MLSVGVACAALMLVGAIVWITPASAPAQPHPSFPSMSIRPGSPDHAGSWWALGLVAGLLTVALLGALAMLGVRRLGRPGRAVAAMAACFAAYGLVFVGLMLSAQGYAAGGSPELTYGFPAPTLWLLVGVWHMPAIAAALLWARYDRWTMTPEDERRFEALVADRRARTRHG